VNFISLLTIVALFFPLVARAFDAPTFPQRGGYEIHSQLPDLYPNDGILDGGTATNPYVLEAPSGQQYEMQPRLPDMFPNDGMLDAGSVTNPWVIEDE